MAFTKIIGAPIVDFNQGDKIEDIISKIISNEKNLYLQMIEICKFIDAVYTTEGDREADFSATLNVGSIVNVTIKYNKLFIKYKVDDNKEDTIIYYLHPSSSGGDTPTYEDKNIIIIPKAWCDSSHLPTSTEDPTIVFSVGDYWYDTDAKKLKVCVEATPYSLRFEDAEFDDDKKYLIVNKFSDLLYYVIDDNIVPFKVIPSTNNILTVNATNPRLDVTGTTRYDCDADILDVYEFINAGGYVIVKGTINGERSVILTNLVEIEETYYAIGLAVANGSLYEVKLTDSVNTAASTLYVTIVRTSADTSSIDNQLTDLENDMSEANFNINQLGRELTEYKTYVGEYLAQITTNKIAINGLASQYSTLASELISVKNSITDYGRRITTLEGKTITVDKALNSASSNPVENKVITNKINELEREIEQGGNIDVDTELNSQSTNPVENKAIKLAINNLQEQINQLDPEGEIDDYDYASDPAYPEHYGAKGDGIPYYDWPLACFNGFESDEVSIESVASDIEVFEPAERIMNKYGLTVNHKGKSMAYCSDSVVYNEPTQKFLLKISNGTEYVYYDKWVNSDVWNSGATGKARTDTVFSDIHELPVSEKQSYGLIETEFTQTITYSDREDAYPVAARKTYIFDADVEEPGLKEIYKTMTDDGAALAAWFAANNGGTMKLRPGVIYYFRHIGGKAISHKPKGAAEFNALVENELFDVASNTTIIGNGAVLFPHRIDPGWPYKRSGTHERIGGHVSIFKLKNQTSVENIHFYDFSVNTLRDKDGNGPAGDNNARFSTSQSSITVFDSDNGITVDRTIIPYAIPNNIYIDKVNAKNVTSYFSSGNTVGTDANMLHDVYISNAIVVGLLGSIVSLRDSVYDNVYMETAPYPGHEGSHLFYFDPNNNNLTIKNSKLVSPDPYREAFITFHAADGRAGTHNLYYENCVIEATGPIFSTTHVTANCNITVHFKNSTISKTFDTCCGDNVMANAYYILRTQYKSWEFVNSVINVRTGVVSDSGDYKLTLKDTTVNSDLAVPAHKSLFGWDSDNVYSSGIYVGPVEVSNFKTNYLGPLGFNLPVDTRLSDAEQQLLMIKRLMLGTDADVKFGTIPPVNPAVGDLYFDITTSTLYRCTAVGTPSYVAIKINKDLTGAPYTSTQTITLNSNEVIPVTFKGDETSVTTVEGRLARILLDAGYKQGNITSVYTNKTPGQFYFAASGTLYLFITSKGQTTVDINNCIDVYGSSYPIIDKAKSLGSSYLYSAQGTPPTWQEVSGISGIIGEIQGLDYRVEQLEG